MRRVSWRGSDVGDEIVKNGATLVDGVSTVQRTSANGRHGNVTAPHKRRNVDLSTEFQSEIVATLNAWQARASEWRLEKAQLEEDLATARRRAEEILELVVSAERRLADALDDADKGKSAVAELDRANAEISALRSIIETFEQALVREREQQASARALAEERLAEEKRVTQLLKESLLQIESAIVYRNHRTIAVLQREHNALQERLDSVYASKFWLAKTIVSRVMGMLVSRVRKSSGAALPAESRSAAS